MYKAQHIVTVYGAVEMPSFLPGQAKLGSGKPNLSSACFCQSLECWTSIMAGQVHVLKSTANHFGTVMNKDSDHKHKAVASGKVSKYHMYWIDFATEQPDSC